MASDDKQMSQQTYDDLLALIRQIRDRANRLHDDDTRRDAERAETLLRLLSTDLCVEGRI
jgi:hypothetical protein